MSRRWSQILLLDTHLLFSFQTGANFQTQFSGTLRESGALCLHKEGVYNTTTSTHGRYHFFFFILQKDLKSLFIYLFNLIRICWRMNNTQILGRYWIKICIHPRYSLLFMPPAPQPVSVSMFTHKESLLLVFFFQS